MTKPRFPSDVAFTPAVKAIQERHGSRAAYARMEAGDGWETAITPDLAAFIAAQDSFVLASASADGQPYVQHRGGPPGFLRVLAPSTLGFADYRGNRQYVTAGNLSENPRVQLLLIDYAHRSRVKIWGRARMVEGDAALLAALHVAGSAGRPERAMLIDVVAWDANCPQHIPQRLDAGAVATAIAERDQRIARLEAELARHRVGAAPSAPRP